MKTSITVLALLSLAAGPVFAATPAWQLDYGLANGVKRSQIEALFEKIGRTRVSDADRKSFGTLVPCNQ
jgi:hypothetical protein